MKKLFITTILVAILLGVASPGFTFITTIFPDGTAWNIYPLGEIDEGIIAAMSIDPSSLNISFVALDSPGNPKGYFRGKLIEYYLTIPHL